VQHEIGDAVLAVLDVFRGALVVCLLAMAGASLARADDAGLRRAIDATKRPWLADAARNDGIRNFSPKELRRVTRVLRRQIGDVDRLIRAVRAQHASTPRVGRDRNDLLRALGLQNRNFEAIIQEFPALLRHDKPLGRRYERQATKLGCQAEAPGRLADRLIPTDAWPAAPCQ